jgi:NTE family protein
MPFPNHQPSAVPVLPLQRAPLGLVLSGGGARGAYQVGVLKAIAELLPANAPVPFQVICGTSAGAIIGALIAGNARNFRQGCTLLESVWRNFSVGQVFRADTMSMLRSGLHTFLALVSGGWLVPPPHSLLDNKPLRELLERHVNFARIRQALDAGDISALAISASSYTEGRSVTFFAQAQETPPWETPWSRGELADLQLDHLMASAAVPLMFPPVAIDGVYYGDGAMRQVTPLSAATHLGARRLLVIGVRPTEQRAVSRSVPSTMPSFAQIMGFMLDSVFSEQPHVDAERLQQENLLGKVGSSDGVLGQVVPFLIVPSEDFGAIAARHMGSMPRTLRILLRTLGAKRQTGSTLLSYLLFEGEYTRELIALGYADAMARREALQAFLWSDS